MTDNRRPRFETFRPSDERAPGHRPLPPLDRPPVGRAMRREEPVRRGGVLRWLAWGIASLLALGVAGAAVLVFAAPVGLVRDELVRQVKAKTGRDLQIAGKTSLAFYPRVSVTMADVALSPPPGMDGGPTVRVASLEAVVQVWPLLQRRIEVSRLVLRQPAFDLRVDAKGRQSWVFAAEETAPRIRLAQAQTGGAGKFAPPELKDFIRSASPQSREVQGSRGPLAALEGLSLADVRVIDGSVRYADERSGFTDQIKGLNVELAMPSLASPLTARGDLVWKAEKLAFKTHIATLKGLTEQRPARLALSLSGRPFALNYEGAVTLGGIPDLDGKLSAKAGSLRQLAGWLGGALPEASGFGAATLAGNLKTTDQAFTLADAELALDGATARGTVTFEPRVARPYVKANLQISELDLNKYAFGAAARGAAAPARPAARPAAAPAAPATPPARSIDDLLKRSEVAPAPGARVLGYTQAAGWSEKPIDLGGFAVADVDAKLSVGRLLYQDIKVGASQLTVGLKDKVLKASFDEVQLYEGRGRGLLTVDASARGTAIAANMAVEGISALPLLKDLAGFDWIAGRGKLTVAAAGQGLTQRQIVETTNGRVDVLFNDGALVGFNVAQILRGLQQGRLSGFDRVATEKTDFSELAASFTIAKGIAQNNDLRLASPLVRLSGAGTVNLPQRTIDYTARPKLVANLSGQGGGLNRAGLEVPVKVVGPWDKPQIAPDLDGVLRNPDQAVQAVKEIGRQLKGRNAEEVLRGLLGGGQGGEASQQAKPKELLNQLLKR